MLSFAHAVITFFFFFSCHDPLSCQVTCCHPPFTLGTAFSSQCPGVSHGKKIGKKTGCKYCFGVLQGAVIPFFLKSWSIVLLGYSLPSWLRFGHGSSKSYWEYRKGKQIGKNRLQLLFWGCTGAIKTDSALPVGIKSSSIEAMESIIWEFWERFPGTRETKIAVAVPWRKKKSFVESRAKFTNFGTLKHSNFQPLKIINSVDCLVENSYQCFLCFM